MECTTLYASIRVNMISRFYFLLFKNIQFTCAHWNAFVWNKVIIIFISKDRMDFHFLLKIRITVCITFFSLFFLYDWNQISTGLMMGFYTQPDHKIFNVQFYLYPTEHIALWPPPLPLYIQLKYFNLIVVGSA